MPQNYSNFQTQRNRVIGQGLERAATWAVMFGADIVKAIVNAIGYLLRVLIGKY